MTTSATRISEPRRNRKSQQKSIKEDFLNFINSDDVKGFIGEEAQKDVYFIVDRYADAFIDKIKLPLLKAKEADFKGDKIINLPRYSNYTPLILIHSSESPTEGDFAGRFYYELNLIEQIYYNLLNIILDVLLMLEKKGEYAKSKLGADIRKALNSTKGKAEQWLNIKLDHKKAEMLLDIHAFCRNDTSDFRDEWYFEHGEKIEKYFNIDLGFTKIMDENGEIEEIIEPARHLSFQEITGIEIDDITLELIIPFLQFISETGYAHRSIFKNRITDEEKQPINEFLYELNDVFGLGIKKEINDGLFISLIIDGYFALQEKDEN